MAHNRIFLWSIILLVGAIALTGCGGGDDGAAAPAPTATVTRFAILEGANEVPAVITTANGTGSLTVDTGTGAVSGSLIIQSAPSTTVNAAHVHEGASGVNGGVIIPLTDSGGGVWSVPAGTVLTAAQITSYTAGSLYFNVHTTANAGGEIRGQIDRATATLHARLDGAQEVPSVITSAAGTGSLTVNADTGAASGSLTITVLPATTVTQAHVHSADRGVNGSVIIPLTDSSGGVWSVPAGIVLTQAQKDLFIAGNLYYNVHTQTNAGGEIRGQIDLIAP